MLGVEGEGDMMWETDALGEWRRMRGNMMREADIHESGGGRGCDAGDRRTLRVEAGRRLARSLDGGLVRGLVGRSVDGA